jgi:hypothetical protein
MAVVLAVIARSGTTTKQSHFRAIGDCFGRRFDCGLRPPLSAKTALATTSPLKNPNRLWLARAVGGLKGECTFIIARHFNGT